MPEIPSLLRVLVARLCAYACIFVQLLGARSGPGLPFKVGCDRTWQVLPSCFSLQLLRLSLRFGLTVAREKCFGCFGSGRWDLLRLMRLFLWENVCVGAIPVQLLRSFLMRRVVKNKQFGIFPFKNSRITKWADGASKGSMKGSSLKMANWSKSVESS